LAHFSRKKKRTTEITEEKREHGGALLAGQGCKRLSGKVEGGEGGDDALGFEGDGDDLADEAEDVLGVGVFSFKAVGVVDDAGAGVGRNAVLVDDPFEGGAVAEAVVAGGCGDAAEEQEVVVAEFGFVFGELLLEECGSVRGYAMRVVENGLLSRRPD
jgi:hypothetical protein